MKVSTSWIALAAAACVAGCATVPKPEPTPLQIQAYQTKEFEVDKTVALGSVINVFQDLGYIIQSADKDTGFITATSPSKSSMSLLDVLVGSSSTSQTKATAFLEEIRPSFTTVRLNFVVSDRQSSEKGRLYEVDRPVTDPQAYRIAFDKIEDAIFVRVGMRPPAAVAQPQPAQASP